jgi:PTS system beta-glucosides-specific IIC component
MAKVSIKDVVAGLGGIENITSATHCATRLRVSTKDKSKVDITALKALDGVIGVVDGATQTHIVIGAEANTVYKQFCEFTGVTEEEAISDAEALKEDLKGKKGAGLTLFFETVARIFNPIVPALAGSGFLSAIIMVSMKLGASMASPTFSTFVTISMAIFTFIPFLLAVSTAEVFKMNKYTALTICAAMMASKWSALLADGVVNYSFLGIPFRVVNYASSVLPIVFAVIIASYIEKALNKVVPGVLKIIVVPAFTILFGTLITFWTIGPATYWIGIKLADAVNWLFTNAGWVAGLVYGGIYSSMVVLGIHHGMVPVLTQMIATNGFNYISPTSGSANIGQAGAAFGVWLKSKSQKTKSNAVSGCIAACVGITEPVIYGVTVPNGKVFFFGAIGGAVGGGLAGILGLKAYAMGGPSFLNFGMFLGGDNALTNCLMVMACFAIAFVVAALLTYFFWEPTEE